MRVWGVICLPPVDFFLFILVVLWLGLAVVLCEAWWRKYKARGASWRGSGFGEVFALSHFSPSIWPRLSLSADAADLGLNCVMPNSVPRLLWDFGFVSRLSALVLKPKSFIPTVFEILCAFFAASIRSAVFFKVQSRQKVVKWCGFDNVDAEVVSFRLATMIARLLWHLFSLHNSFGKCNTFKKGSRHLPTLGCP